MIHHGFEHVYHIAGGFTAWKKIVGQIEMLETQTVS
jgi:rhodanese-related sulfurtransferase